MQEIRAAMFTLLQAEHPMTVRQTFYRLVTSGAISKSEAEYKGTVCRLLTEMRRAHEIPFTWLSDSTRWMRKGSSYSSMEEALQHTADCYRRCTWDNQGAYVEIWLEKDALSGVLYGVTNRWDAPLMVTRGYPSLSFLYGAAEQIAAQRKPTWIYYFGDHDPSGVDIPRKVEADLREMAPQAEIHFQRVAVTLEQIEAMSLPTRPTKTTDSRSRNFEGESVEVDAIPPRELRRIAASCIEAHIDFHAWDMLRQTEEAEREGLRMIALQARNRHED